MFLDDALTAPERAAVAAVDPGSDIVSAQDREIYVWYPAGMSGSQTAELLGRALRNTVTDRNWNTVLKLEEAARSISA